MDKQLELEVKRMEIMKKIKDLEVDLELVDRELSNLEKDEQKAETLNRLQNAGIEVIDGKRKKYSGIVGGLSGERVLNI